MTKDSRAVDVPRVLTHDASVHQQASLKIQMTTQVLARIGAGAAPIGAMLLIASTALHPSNSHPSDHAAAFAEYSADSIWVWSHLGQFLGFAGLAVALAALASTFEAGRPAAWGRVGLVGAVSLLVIAAVLQAVDGVALKAVVDYWADASIEEQQSAFQATLAVRQVEIGIASFLSLVSGLTVIVFGIAITVSDRYPIWLGGLAILGGLGALLGGLAQATTGFSDLAMTLSMPSSVVLLGWAIMVGAHMWRLAPRLAGSEGRDRSVKSC